MWDHIDPNVVEKKFGGNKNVMINNFWPLSPKFDR